MACLVVPDLRVCFDASYYLDRYPDVQQSGLDPLAHFLLYGGREGRSPSALFDAKYYLSENPDVTAAGSNPLVHFLRFGWKEGRRPNPLFDAVWYTAHVGAQLENANPFTDFVMRRGRGERPRGTLPFTLHPQSYQVATKVSYRKYNTIDIVIPVYSGLEETRTCLKSVLEAVCKTPYRIILVNDQTPDPALGQYLREAAAAHGLTLLENSRNLGFAGSVNRALELEPTRDIVLLNNDTEVANDWLDRLAAAAYSECKIGQRIGTVTPFSNNATLCSYPKLNASNRLPGGISLGELDRIFGQVNAGYRVRIPTAVGFCMYIRRDCLNEVGGFREEIFGKGYGEENDFCLRALYKGYESVLATDVFVYHRGETSFGDKANARRTSAAEIVQRLYPEYGRMIAEHLQNDPAKPYRIAVSAWRMRHSGRPVILSISHDLGGGVAQYMTELWETLAGKAEMLVLTPGGNSAVTLRNLHPEDDFRATFDIENDYDALLEVLRRCGVSRLHVQHLLGHSLDVERLRSDLNVPLDYSVHDYFAICPQVTLTDPSGRYCGEPDATTCNVCLAGRPPWPRLDIEAWRQKYAPLVTGATRVIAPSRDAADRMRRYFPTANIVAAAHPDLSRAIFSPGVRSPVAEEPLVIAVLGVMNQHKGIQRLRAAASEAQRRNLPLRFVLAGYVDEPAAAGEPEPFSQTGPYNNDELPRLLREAGAHVVWFPVQWPETFSYTLTACINIGLAAIVPDIGAFAERVEGRAWTWVMPWDWDSARMVEFFVAVRRDHFLTGVPPPVPNAGGATASADFYPVQYLSNRPPEQGHRD